MATETTPGPRKQRSPSYPAVGLEEALARALSLYENFGRAPAHVEVALKALGYGPKSGGGRVLIAALKKFGLLSDEGSKDRRQVQLTSLALRIVLDNRPDSPERAEAIRTAALTPNIYRELWDRYGPSLPGDDTLAYYLRVERAFTDSAVREFVPDFRATVEFANLADEGDTVSRVEEDKSDPSAVADREPHREAMTPPVATADPREGAPTSAPLPLNVNLVDGGEVTIRASQKLTEEAWEQLMAVLGAHKPGLIRRD